MTKQGKGYLLKIFSGPHAGAEIPLARGAYILGSDDDCDIIISDPGVAARHIRLSLSDGRMVVSAMEEAFYLDGEKAGDGEPELAPFQIVTIGATHFAIGPGEEAWPSIHLPVLHAEDGPDEGEEAPGREKEVRGEETGETGAQPVQVKGVHARPKRVLLFLICGLLLLVIAVFILLSGEDRARTRHRIQGRPAQMAALRGMLKSLEPAGLTVEALENGRLSVHGFVETDEKKNEIVRAVRGMDPPVRVRVNVVSRLVASAGETLEAMGLRLDVRSGGEGRIVLRGYVRERGALQKAIDILEQDLPAVRGIENRVLTQEDLIPFLFERLEPLGLEGKIRFHTYPDHIMATGSLTEQEREDWGKVKEAFISRFGQVIPIMEDLSLRKTVTLVREKGKGSINGPESERAGIQQAAPVPMKNKGETAGPEIDLPIRAVSMGNIRYLTLEDGIKYFEGGKLSNGYIIRSITRDRIVLYNGSREVNLFLRR